MADAAIYYYPDGSGTLETIDIQEAWTTLDVLPQRTRQDSVSLTGRRYTTTVTHAARIRVTLERWSGLTVAGKALARHLMSLAAHLEDGGSCVVVEDTAKAVVLFSRFWMPRGQVVLRTNGEALTGILSGTLAVNDEVRIQGGYNTWARELELVSAYDAGPGKVTLNTGTRYAYEDHPIMITDRGTWVAMKLPADQLGSPIVTHDHRLTYSFELELVQDWGVVANIHEHQDGYNDGVTAHGITLEAGQMNQADAISKGPNPFYGLRP